MADIDMDLDPNADKFPAPIERSEQVLKVMKVDDGVSKKGGYPQSILHLAIEGGDFDQRKIGRVWVTFFPKDHAAHGITLHALKAFGLITAEDMKFRGTTQDFLDKTARAVIAPTDDGKYNEVETFLTGDAKMSAAPPKRRAAPAPVSDAAAGSAIEEVPF